MDYSADNVVKPTVLVTGGSGFIGQAICKAIKNGATHNIRILTRDNNSLDDEKTHGDLNDIASLADATDGVSAIIHSASYIGYDTELCQRINVDGTRNLIHAAQEKGIETIIYVSTSAVYGNGIHKGIRENEISPSPVSVLSRSRLKAETLILATGGTVVRPHLIYGEGDKWVIPLGLRTLTTMGAFINNADAKISTIRVDHLGLLIASLLKCSRAELAGTILHANDRLPMQVRDIFAECAKKLTIKVPSSSISFSEGWERVRSMGITEHQLAIFWLDHWYDSSKIHNLTALTYKEGFHLDDTSVAWYSGLRLHT